MQNDSLFKGLTRPAMFLGVPLVPFYIALGFCILLATWTNLLYFSVFFIIFALLRVATQIDEKIFQIYGLKFYLFSNKLKAISYKKMFSANVYTAGFNKISEKPKNEKGNITMLDLEKAIGLSEVIPYSSLISDSVVITKNGFLVSSWMIEGISYETRDDEELDRFKIHLNTLIRSLSSETVAIYCHNVRNFSEIKINNNFDNDFANEINTKYLESFKNTDFMENSLFITLVMLPNNQKIDKINNKMLSKNERLDGIKAKLHKFEEISDRFESSLSKFGILKLSNYEKIINEKPILFSQQLEFYHFLLTGRKQEVRVLNSPIYNYLHNIEIYFSKDMGQITCQGKNTFVRSIEIKEWDKNTHAGFLNELISVRGRYVLTQSFSMLSKQKAKRLIENQEKRMKSTDDDSIRELDDLVQAKDDLTSGEICFGEHHFTLVLYSDTVDELKKLTNEVFTKMDNIGLLTTLSNISLDEAYYSQLPANFQFRPRTSLITSLNFAGLNSLHNNPVGKANLNCWGEATTVLKTQTDTPFYFNFHQTKIGRNDFGDKHLGHTLIIGQAGTGKTALCSFLLNQCMQYRLPESFPENSTNKEFLAIYLDKDYGAEINIKALGGVYNRLKNGMSTGFNPFMLENNAENIDFLNTLVSILATADGSKLSTADREKINFSVNSVMNLDIENRFCGISRLLENIQEDINDDNSLKKRLSIWKKGNIYGWVFDNESDTLNFDKSSVYGFDGTEILDNKEIIQPLAFYILHRIKKMADGRRLVLFLDEFWKWLQGDSFKDFVYDGLKTFRKLNAFIIGATQSPDEILRNPISRAIIEQTETFIFLPNSKGDEEEYTKGFKVSEKEFKLIKELASDSRQFLVKKGNESEGDTRGNTVMAKLDLSTIGKGNMKILSSSIDNVAILEEIIEEVGDNPKIWIPIFKEKCV